MPGARATARKSSSSSSRKTIAKAEKVTNFTCAQRHDYSGKITDSQITRLLKRGISLADAYQLLDILQCSIEELIRMYKCRKGMIPNVLGKARVWASKKKKQPPPKPKSSGSNPPRKRKDQSEIIYWIGDYCEMSDKARFEAKENDKVMVANLAFLAPNKECMEAAVEVRDVYDANCIEGIAESARRVKRKILQGKLLTPFDAYYMEPGKDEPALRRFAPGCKVRFYLENVVAVVQPGKEFVDSDVESLVG